MHATFLTTTTVALLSLQSVLAEHGNMPMQNHARFARVKRGGATIHLIGDETVARWSGGGVPNLPVVQATIVSSATTTWNLLDSINAGLGAPIGKATASSSSSSSSSSIPVAATSAQVADAKAKVALVSTSSSTAEETTSQAAQTSASQSGAPAATLAVGRTKKIVARSLPEQGVVAEDASEDVLFALGRRAAAANSTATLAVGRNKVVLTTSASVAPSTSVSADPSSAATATATARAAIGLAAGSTISAADLATPQGWGGPFENKYTTMSIINHSVKSASTRAIVRDMWPQIIASVKGGDFVVIQLGHKESGMPSSSADIKSGCVASVPGLGGETMTVSGCNGQQEVVQTYGTYIKQMCESVKAKGATCVVASITPKNEWKRDNTLTYNSPYIGYAKSAAAAAGAIYLPHEETIAKKLIADGQDLTLKYFLDGQTVQPNAAGADVFASTFAAAAYCAGASGLTSSFTAAGQALSGKYC